LEPEVADARALKFADRAVAQVRPSFLYRLGIAAVAGMMIVLPLFYLALVFGLVAGIVSFAVSQFPVSVYSPAMPLYAVVLVAGVTIVAFLVKPLFVAAEEGGAIIELEPGEQARLERLVTQISGIVRAPMPARIAIDCAVNASVSFRRGMRSLFSGDLILVIGLPLVRNLDARSFAGVIAHEMGHFSQGAGMRLTYVIRRLNGWFYKAVYHRDGWDRWLRRGARASRLGILFQIAQLGIWCSRKILFVLMLAGQAVSCFVLRRMEFDADHYEICVSGTDGFRETTERIALLHEAATAARRVVDEGLIGGKLPDDLPLLMSRLAGLISSDSRDRIARRMTTAGGRLLDTHPSDWERIGRALTMNESGLVLDARMPAGEIFDDLDALSRRATRHHCAVVGEDRSDEDGVEWVPSAQLADFEEKIRTLENAADRFAGCRLELWDALIRAVPPPLGRGDDLASLQRSLRGVTRAFNGSAARCAKIASSICQLDDEVAASLKGKELMLAGYSLERKARDRVASGLAQRVELAALRDELEDFQMLASQRLGLVLELGWGSEKGDHREALTDALPFLEVCYQLRPLVTRLRELLQRQTILIQHMDPSREDSFEFRSQVQANAAHLRVAHAELLSAVAEINDPIDSRTQTMAEWLGKCLPPTSLSDDPVFRSYQQAGDAVQRLGQRYRQVLGLAATVVFDAEERMQAES
jgi:Zn-dependent protease with chaperone function